ncbi:G5 domain-containing protein [Bacillus sp. UNC438CL73TsuS30]|uniref:G5 domain-containing protein n=1 Tax=Bacillus sp. UNC438CL73TsuS30 TaxID=1340434 RepID=UPI00047E326E|nr:G5 domain-containing protein [Bacillus sp. UNC438CL73TsuS30]
MGKNQQMIKLFVVLFFSTAFIFSFSHYGALAFENFSNPDGKYSNGTTIGGIDISGKSQSEVVDLLNNHYTDWLKNSKVNLQYTEKIAPFDLKDYKFDSATTISSIKDGQSNSLFVTIDKAQVEEQLQINFPQVNSKDIDVDKLTKSLSDTASKLEVGTFNFNLYNDYLLAGTHEKNAVISKEILKLTDVPVDLPDLVNQISKIEIHGQSTFSILEFAKKHHIENFSSLNIMVTGFYQSILPTNFLIVERNISSKLPSYATLGNEARVGVKTNSDLIIENPNQGNFTLEYKLDDKRLIVTLKGERFMYSYKISKKNKQDLKPKTILQYSPLLLAGQSKIQTQGKNGHMVKVYREVYEGEKLVKTNLISDDYYPPIFQVEVHGLSGSTQDAEQSTNNGGTKNTSDNIQSGTGTTDDTNGNPTKATDSTQNSSNDSNLWGKPNEQPK